MAALDRGGGLADFADGGVDAVLGVDEDLGAPQALGDFGSSHEIAVVGCQENEQLHRPSFQLQVASGTGEFEAAGIQPEVAEHEDGDGDPQGTPRRKCSSQDSEIDMNPSLFQRVSPSPKLHHGVHRLFIAHDGMEAL
jgi:hypothetical protein